MDILVSRIESITSKHIVHQSLKAALESIREGELKEVVSRMRAVIDIDHNQYDAIKGTLPAHVFSGQFVGGHGLHNMVDYNRLMTLDIDKLSEEGLVNVRKDLSEDPYVYAFWLSPSGKGYKGLVQLDYGDIELNDYAYWHREAFNQLYKYFVEKYGFELDIHCKDVPRLCFVSYDPDLLIKEAASPFTVQPIAEVKVAKQEAVKARKNRATWNYNGSFYNHPISGRNKSHNRKLMSSIIRYLENRNLSITTTYEEWFSVAMAVVSTFNYDVGEKYYLRLCRLDGPKHDEKASVSLLRYCYEHSNFEITFGTLIYYAQRKGYHFSFRAVPIVDIKSGD